jgi:membrane protease YdiL (CAAX protease family)
MSTLPPSQRPPGPAPPEPREDVPPWSLWMLPAALGTGLGLWLVGSAIVAVIAHAGGSSVTHPTPAVSLGLDFVFDLAFVLAALYFGLVSARGRLADFGYRRVSPPVAVSAFLSAALGYYALTLVYASVFALHGQDKLPSELGASKSTAALAGAAVFVCVIAPIAEELFFRGFIFGSLRRIRLTVGGRDLGTWVAALLTGVLFGLVHAGSASSQYLVPLGLLGFVLCLVRWRTRSLYPCMALHSVNNALALGVNQLHWSAGEIVGLMIGALAVIAAITGPLSGSGHGGELGGRAPA